MEFFSTYLQFFEGKTTIKETSIKSGVNTMSKYAVITGASRGIGKGIALQFAKQGYHIAINCIKNEQLLEQVKEEAVTYGVRCITFTGDISIEETAIKFFQLIAKEFKQIDVLVNNAGISYIGVLSDMTSTEWDTILRTNLTSVFLCSKLCIPIMLQRKEGRIINISSVWGVAGASCEVAYSATKGGINSFTKALAKELAPSNITVNAIAFGAIDTEMNQFLTPSERSDLEEEIPSGRFGKIEDAAEFVYTIASANSYLTGQVIPFDGAWL